MFAAQRFALVFIFSVVALFGTRPSEVISQDLPESKRSVIVFDFQIDQLLEYAERFGADLKTFNAMPMEGIFEGILPTEMKRVSGSMSLPENVDGITQMGLGGEIPFEFHVQFEFSKEDSFRMLNENIQAGSVEIEIDGRKFWIPKDEAEAPKGMMGRAVSKTVFEFGTRAYLTGKDPGVMTPTLAKAWKDLPDQAFRVAVDLVTPAGFIAEAVGMAQENSDPQTEAYLDLLDNLKSVVIGLDPKSETLLFIEAVGIDEERAEEVQGGLDSLLGLAKMGGQMAMGQLTKDVPEAGSVVKELLDSLNAVREKEKVRVVIPRPDGFEAAVKEMVEFGKAEAVAMSGLNNFRQMALAVHNYESAHQQFPFANEEDELGWRVRILPFLDQGQLYNQIEMDEGHASETNAEFAELMPAMFGSDEKNATVARIQTDANGFGMITDGSSNTIMLIEYPQGEPWMENGSLSIEQAIKLVEALKDGEKLMVAFYDGSCRRIGNSVDKETLRRLFDPTDGEVIDNYDF